MNGKAALGTQGVSGARGTLHTPALPQPGFAVRLEEAACTLRGVQPWPGMGDFFQLLCGIPQGMGNNTHTHTHTPLFFFLWNVPGRYYLLIQLGPAITPQIPVHCQRPQNSDGHRLESSKSTIETRAKTGPVSS